ncbi:DUF4389 domain-containing protein [archaeon]|jgi:hypothetical protein|nr:DUF4389 domain-containing protein [archaeon]
MAKKKSEKKEAWMRIVVGIVSGIILDIWGALIFILAVLNWIITVFSGKRDRGVANFCEYWSSEMYRYLRYMTFATNQRPFPFSEMVRLNKFER